MEAVTLLRDLVIAFAVAVVVVALLRRIGVPPIAGFILAGALIGPNAFGFVTDVHRVEVLADVGVVLLLFGIGLELSLERVRRLWRLVLFGGALQVGVSIAAASGIALAFGMSTGSAILVGCIVSVSSTAIVLRGLRLRGEIDAPHGRLTLGILIFQDLCVVPMILAIPLLGGTHENTTALLLGTGRAIVVLVVVLAASRLFIGRLLHVIAKTRQRDLFVLSVFVICLGTAWVLSSVGVPLALGAFLAGLVVAGSEYRHQALSDLIPFREVLTSLFFVSVGMFLDPATLANNVAIILWLLVAIVLGKFLIVWGVAGAMRLPMRVAVLSATALAQIGEFSFILMRASTDAGLLETAFLEALSMAIILSMLVTPLAIGVGPHLAAGVGRLKVVTRRLEVRSADETPSGFKDMHGHVIVAGYGLAGRELSHSLEDLGMPFIIVDLNPENVRGAIKQVMPAYFGDITSPEVLEQLGARRARELVIVINDPRAAEMAIRAARRVAPDLFILARTQYVADISGLIEAGASEVVSAELEASAEITSRVLARHRATNAEIGSQVSRIRHLTEE